jgi:hypothetical protein
VQLYDSKALTALAIWQEIEGTPERAFTADLEGKKGYLCILGCGKIVCSPSRAQ